MKTDIRMVASDIGGTLANSREEISDHTAATLRRAMAGGTYVTLVSGYNLNVINRHVAKIGPDDRLFAIVQNGAMILEGDRILETNFLPISRARDAVRFFVENGLSPIAFGGPDRDARLFVQQVSDEDPLPGARKYDQIPDLQAFLTADPVQVSIYAATSRIQELAPQAEALFGGDCYVVLSIGPQKSWLEINHPCARKVTALEKVLERVGVSARETMYFGDNLNDVDALRAVGYPVVMANGLPEVQKLAWRLAPSNDEDGVARVMEDVLGLNNLK